MTKHLLRVSIMVMTAFCSISSFGQSFTATYDFSDLTSGTLGRVDPTPPPVVTGVTFGSFSAAATVSEKSTAGSRFSYTGWPTGATSGSDDFTGSIDETKFYEVTLTPKTYYSFDLASVTFKLQRSGTGIRQYVVRSSTDGFTANLPGVIDPANANLQVISGNIFQVTDATSGYEGSKVLLTGASFTDIDAPITFRFYGFNAEGASGSFSLDDVTFNGTALISASAPNIVISPGSVAFPPTSVADSKTLSFTVTGSNLADPVIISTELPFSVSDDMNGTYVASLSIPAAELATAKTIYVKFSPVTTGTYTDHISLSSTDATTKDINLTGDGIDPANLVFDFDDCTVTGVPGSGFTSYSVTGDQVWACTSFGHTGNGVDINGYSGGAQDNEDWLISPPLDATSIDLPVFRFWSKGDFTGPQLQLLISTDYDGFSDPNSATWTDLNANFPALNSEWTMTDGIDLSAYKSAPFYIAFKYISNNESGAARFTIDDVDITNRTQLLYTSPLLLNFDEVSSGSHSVPLQFTVKSVGFGDVTLAAPSGYEVSADGMNFSSSIVVNESTMQAGTSLFARFSPTERKLKVEGMIHFTGIDLDSNMITLTGSSYPKSETFDAGCYNLSFFGSNPTNNPTQDKIDLQVNNIATVVNKLDLDILGVEEVSNDDAFATLITKLPNHSSVISNRWSYSFEAPDPNFPPQKTGFIYDNTTATLISSRDMFVDLYDKARTTNPELLPGYPGGTPSSFWASGRLPFMATFDVTINGKTERIIMIDIHAKSSSDQGSYNRRVYDVQVLKDSLDAYYANDKVIIVGDYNDRAFGSIHTGSISPYQPFVDDNTRYDVLTLPLDEAGRVSFLTGTGLIDHITVTTGLLPFYITNSTDIEDPRSYIPNYNATTASDHMPVFTRFNFSQALPVTLINFDAHAIGNKVLVSWSTSTEQNSDHFVVERSSDSRTFIPVAVANSAGNRSAGSQYQFTDSFPSAGINYYKLKQVDRDGKIRYSNIVAVAIGGDTKNALAIYPNPVSNHLRLNLNSNAKNYSAKIAASDGRVILTTQGDINDINQQINRNLFRIKQGVYILTINNTTDVYSIKFIKQ